MKILVTGAAGFVGRALVASLENSGHYVLSVVRHSAIPIANTLIIDADENTDWSDALRDCEVVLHLAFNTKYSHTNSTDLLAANRHNDAQVTLNLAYQAAQANVRRFIFVSSIKVNGEHTDVGAPFNGEDIPCPEDDYAISKNMAEQGLMRLARKFNMELAVIRPPLVYGPGVKGNFLRIMRAIDKRCPLPFGAIQNRRSLIYLGNLVDVICLCMNHPAAAGKTFTVSDGEDLSTPELTRRVGDALGRSVFLVPVPVSWMKYFGKIFNKQHVVDRLVNSLVVDMASIQQQIGWKPPLNMTAGLEETARWYRSTEVRE